MLHVILSTEVRIFPGDVGLWHQAGCTAFKVRQSLSTKRPQNAEWSSLPVPSLNTNQQWGSELRLASIVQMFLAPRKGGEIYWNSQWNRALSPASAIVTQQNAGWSFSLTKPGVGISATGFPPSSKTVIVLRAQVGVTGEVESWPQQTHRMMTLGKGRRILTVPPLSHPHCSLLCREHLPGKSVISAIINCSSLLL